MDGRRKFDKGMSFYKKALDRAPSPDEKAKIHMQMGVAFERSGSRPRQFRASQRHRSRRKTLPLKKN